MDDGEDPGTSEPVNAGVVGGPNEFAVHAMVPCRFADPATALDWALAMFDRHRLVTARLWRGLYPGRGVGVVLVREAELLLFVEPDRGDLPGGDDGLLQEVASLLPARGYRQVVVPDQVTPLAALRPLLTTGILNCLWREGYSSAEQVAVLPEAALRAMPRMGDNSIATLRTALATIPGIAAPGTSTSLLMTAAQAADLDRLLAELNTLAQAHGRRDLADRGRAWRHTLQQGTARRRVPWHPA